MKIKITVILLLFFTGMHWARAQGKVVGSDATIVVYNNADPDSEGLAKYYAQKREIPDDQVIGLGCTTTEEMSREEYDRDIAEPLREIFTTKKWWKTHENAEKQTVVDENKIRFVALIRGIPLKIAQTTGTYAGDKANGPPDMSGRNEACVDSELATLGFFSHIISGALENPYYRDYSRITEVNMPQLMLVCRLDAPTPQIVRRMIDDSIEAEQTGLWGFAYVDSRNIHEGGLARGDKWLTNIVEDAQKHGIPVIHDNGPDLFPADYPMRYAAFYYGWYAENIAGPFLQPGFRFNKGAIACHIHSFSASTLRSESKNWAGPLLARGADAVLGNVYEPYLALTSNLDIFHDRIESGFSFAEAGYASVQGLSWMNTFIGDPLYRPLKVIDDNLGQLPKPAAEWAAYKRGAQIWFKDGAAAGEKALTKSARDLHSGIILESLGLLQAGQNDFLGALESFQQARVYYTNNDDIIRAAIHEASILRAMNRNDQAHQLITRIVAACPGAVSATLLKKLDPTNPPH